MKKIAFAAFAASTLLATPAFAQFGSSGTDSTTITSSVALVCTIDAPAGGQIVNNANTPIGTSSAQCNDPDGFTATVSSANGGFLKSTQANNATTLPYTLDIPGVGQLNLASNAVLPRTPGDQGAVDGISFPTSVTAGSYNGPAFAGTYTDTITYTIVPN